MDEPIKEEPDGPKEEPIPEPGILSHLAQEIYSSREMPPKRRRTAPVEEEEKVEMEDGDVASQEDGYENEDAGEDDEDGDDAADRTVHEHSIEGELVKNMVRYALACEYSRTPIRRDAIKERVLGEHGRSFKTVFARAQKQLAAVFGMEMVELPTRDRALMTLEQKRKAGKSQTQQASSNAYVLQTILPAAYRRPDIIAPSRAQSHEGEAAYVGLYSTLIATIVLSGGTLSDARLRRHLQRLVVDRNMPSLQPNDRNQGTENTEVVLQRMIRQGYLVKATESKTHDDDSVTWHVGPRGKTEVTDEAVAGMVRAVYGGSSPELEKKLQASLGKAQEEEGEEAVQADEAGPRSQRQREDA